MAQQLEEPGTEQDLSNGAQPQTSDDARRDEKRATGVGQWCAGAVLVIGIIAVIVPAVVHAGAIFADNPFSPRQTSVSVVKIGETGQKTTETTTKEANESFLERSLAAGGLLFLRFGLVALAAFLAGAVVQRTMLGNFALKLGPLEIPELKRAAAASAEAVQKVATQLERQEERLENVMLSAATATEGAAFVKARLDALEGRLSGVLDMLGAPEEPAEGEPESLEVSVDLEQEDT